MQQLITRIRSQLPDRRRRFWRYVSPRRQGAGLALLAILLAAVYVYWHATNDARVRREVVRYLSDFTGMRVDIDHVNFSLFGGITLRGVSIDAPGDQSNEPFLRAQTVLLRHRPWSLLYGRLAPTEITCVEPVVTLHYDVDEDTYNAQLTQIANRRRRGSGFGAAGDLPTIRVRQGRIEVIRSRGHLREVMEQKVLSLLAAPDGEGDYLFTVEEQDGALAASFVLDVTTGRVTPKTGSVQLQGVGGVLPPQYRQWCQRYDLRGEVRLSSRQDNEGVMLAELVNVSLRLPPEEGGLALTGVSGSLAFDESGVELSSVNGTIPQAANARLELSGRYGGYATQSPFELSFRLHGAELPAEDAADGAAAEVLDHFRRMYQPSGRADVSATISRDHDGRLRFTGEARPDGMSIMFVNFPYRLDNVRGLVKFSPEGVELRDITATHGRGRCRISGHVADVMSGKYYDVSFEGEDIAADDDLRQALPRHVVPVWDQFKPAGVLGSKARIYRNGPDDHDHVEVSLLLDGRIAVNYEVFPYPLDGVLGEVAIRDSDVTLVGVRAGRGGMRCNVEGTITQLDTSKPRTDLSIDVRQLPLDDYLAAALSDKANELLSELDVSGMADRVSARVRQSDGGPLNFDVLARLSGVALSHRAFPYPLRDAEGTVAINNDRVVIESLIGRNRQTPISVNGQVFVGGERPGLDIQVKAESVLLDEQLEAALPPALLDIWRQMELAGLVDVTLALRDNLPGQDELDYELTCDARDVSLKCGVFPLKFSGVSGQVVAGPGHITLRDLTSRNGDTTATVSGVIVAGEHKDIATLSVEASNLELGQELLAAMPEELSPLTKRFTPGGVCDVKLTRLAFTRDKSIAASRPASKPVGYTWDVDGEVSLTEATLDLGFGAKTITGKLIGKVRRDENLSMEADISLKSIELAGAEITDFAARLHKQPQGSILVKDITAKAHGGKLAGFGEIKLTNPLQYGINLSMENVRLEQLVAYKTGAEPTDVKGALTGNIQFMAVADRADTQQASGVLRISEAKMYRLPVPLEMLHVVYLTLPGEAAFTDGDVTYRLRGQTLVFEEIYLRGSTISIIGSGTMNMKNEAIDLTFISGPPGKLPRMAALAENLLSSIIREIAVIEIRGTLSNPTSPKTVALRSINAAIQRLLNPASPEGQ